MIRSLSFFLWVMLGSGCAEKVLGGFEVPPPDGTLIDCPVSKKRCAKTHETDAAVFAMRTFYFCCADCRSRFAEAPSDFAFVKK